MKIYNKEKTIILEKPDLNMGYLVKDKILKEIQPAKPYIEEQGHYEVIKEYKNGGKDVKWVVDIEGQEAQEETPIYEDIYVYIEYTKEEILDGLRQKREEECFFIINRGELWYDTLTEEQLNELNNWYNAWLNVTKTEIIPTKPTWIK